MRDALRPRSRIDFVAATVNCCGYPRNLLRSRQFVIALPFGRSVDVILDCKVVPWGEVSCPKKVQTG